jgi:3-hydroxybutyryl-CoA dehydratase
MLLARTAGAAARAPPALAAAAARLLSAAAAAAAGPDAPPPPAPGAAYTITRAFSPEEIAAFVALTGDANPIHAAGGGGSSGGGQDSATRTPQPAVLPGLLAASLFPALIGSAFPGALYLSQRLKFRARVAPGEALAVTVTARGGGGGGSSRVRFETVCRRAVGGEVVVEGEALALLPRRGDS